MKMYDPPMGSKYGFPKEYNPSNPLEPIEYTLRRDGYPEALLEQGMANYCRFWEKGLDKSEKEPINRVEGQDETRQLEDI